MPGLATGADTWGGIVTKLPVVAPELPAATDLPPPDAGGFALDVSSP